MQEKFPAYAHNFEKWAREVQGSRNCRLDEPHSLRLWCSLQHYIGMADDKVREQLGVPAEWEFIAHMPFGKVVEPAQAKDKLPLSQLLVSESNRQPSPCTRSTINEGASGSLFLNAPSFIFHQTSITEVEGYALPAPPLHLFTLCIGKIDSAETEAVQIGGFLYNSLGDK